MTRPRRTKAGAQPQHASEAGQGARRGGLAETLARAHETAQAMLARGEVPPVELTIMLEKLESIRVTSAAVLGDASSGATDPSAPSASGRGSGATREGGGGS